MENDYKTLFQEEKKGVTLSQVIDVVIGNIKRFLIIAAAVFIVCFIALYLYKRTTVDYEALFSYDISGPSKDAYIDGSRFDTRDLITLEKLNKYKAEHEELASLDMEAVFYGNAIKSIKYETTYKKNENKVNDEDADYILEKAGFKVILNESYFTKEQATTLVKAIAEEPISVTKSLIEKSNHKNYLRIYSASKNFESKIENLMKQKEVLASGFDGMMYLYGDVYLENGYYGEEGNAAYYLEDLKISDVKLMMSEYFQGYSLDDLQTELSLAGYIDPLGVSEYRLSLETQKKEIQRQIAINESKLNRLMDQREALVQSTTGTSLYTTELGVYNEQIVRISLEIEDQKAKEALIDISITALNDSLNDPEYIAKVADFENRLTQIYNELDYLTTLYTNVEKKVRSERCNIYYDTNSVVSTTSSFKMSAVLLISVGAAIIVPILVNLVISIDKATKANKNKKEKEEVTEQTK